MRRVPFKVYISHTKRRVPVNEWIGSALKWSGVGKWLAKELMVQVAHEFGNKAVATVGEKFRRSDGSHGTGIRIINSAGDMIRINTEDIHPNRSVIAKLSGFVADLVDDIFTFGLARCIKSIDFWKSSNTNIYRPDYTCEISYLGNPIQFITDPQLPVVILRFILNGKTGEYSLGQGKEIMCSIEKGAIEQNEMFKKIESSVEYITKRKKTIDELVTTKGLTDEAWEWLDLAGYSKKAIQGTVEYCEKHGVTEKLDKGREMLTRIAIICHLKESNPGLNDNQIELVSSRFSDCLG